jgi:hypothetical protein
MRKSTALLPIALLTLAAFPAIAQEVPRVLFCMGQCYGVDDKGDRIPITKGTQLAPGLRLETGSNSYMQVKLGRDAAFGMGERARVRFDRRIVDRDVVILDEGRIRIVGGEAIGRPDTRPVELRTTEGNIVLRSADIEVKTPPKTADGIPALTLVKLNVGDARLGDLPVTRDAVYGIVGGKVLDRVIPIGDIALPAPRRDPAPAGPDAATGRFASPPIAALPIIDLPATEPKPFVTPIAVSPAIVSPETTRQTQLAPSQTLSGTVAVSPTLVYQPVVMPIYTAPVVTASTLIMAYPITTPTGTKSLDSISKETQLSPTIAPTAPLTQTITFQQPTTTTTTTTTATTTPTATKTTTFSPRLTTIH